MTKGQTSGKTTSAVDLLETLPVGLGIVIGGYGLSLCSGQVWFSLVRLWSTPSLRMTVRFGFGTSLHSGLPLGLTSGMSLHSGLPVGLVSGESLHSGPPLVWGDGFDSSFHSGRPPMLSRSFQHLLWLTGATRDSFELEFRWCRRRNEGNRTFGLSGDSGSLQTNG